MLRIRKSENKKQKTLSKKDIKKQILIAEKLIGKTSKVSSIIDYDAEKEFLRILNQTNDIEHIDLNTVINNHLGVIYFKRGELYKSISRFASIMTVNPDNPLVKKNLYKLCHKIIDNGATEDDKSLIEAVRNDYIHARELLIKGDYENLEPIAFRLINDYEINKNTAKWISYSHCFMASIKSNHNNDKNAISHYLEALKIYKNNDLAEKMIYEIFNKKEPETDYEKLIVKINEKDKFINEKEQIIIEKDKKIEKLEGKLINSKTMIQQLKGQLHDYENNKENHNKITSNDNSIEDTEALKQRIAELEKNNKQLKSKMKKIEKKSKHYENEFKKLTSQLENFVTIYKEISTDNQFKLEESA